MNQMMLAHGSTSKFLVEAVGVATRHNFSRVLKSGHKRGNVIRRKLKEKRLKLNGKRENGRNESGTVGCFG